MVVAVATNGSPLVIADEQSTLVDAAATSLSSSSLPSFCAQSEQQQLLQATAGLGSDCLFFQQPPRLRQQCVKYVQAET